MYRRNCDPLLTENMQTNNECTNECVHSWVQLSVYSVGVCWHSGPGQDTPGRCLANLSFLLLSKHGTDAYNDDWLGRDTPSKGGCSSDLSIR